MLSPINFKAWVEENRHLLKPPVGNKLIWSDTDFVAFVVGGPNSRTDFHIDESEEFFYQMEGDMVLRVIEKGVLRNLTIRAGEIFLLPPRVPHSPQRPAHTVGLVIERRRSPEELDGFAWYCEKCNHLLHSEFLHISDIVKDLPPVFDRYKASPLKARCQKCGFNNAQ